MNALRTNSVARPVNQAERHLVFLGPDDIRIRGTRIGIETVLYDYLYQHDSPSVIVDRYPSLSLADVQNVIQYYRKHERAVADYLNRWLAHGDAMRAAQDEAPLPVVKRLRPSAAP